MPIFEQEIKITSAYRVRVEADDEYQADQKIAEMGNDEAASHRWLWTERDDNDLLPREIKR